MSELTKWWTREQLTVARELHPEAGTYREDRGTSGLAGGAYGSNLSAAERLALAAIDWSRV